MTMPTPTTPEDAPLTPLERERDGRLEAILDEMVASAAPGPDLPPDFTARVMAARPFAAWELRRARAWRVPALAAGGLLASSLGIGLAPLWSLGPATAFSVWARLVALAIARPVSGVLSAGPLLAEAVGKAAAGSEGSGWVLGGAAALGATALLVGLRGRRSVAAHGARH